MEPTFGKLSVEHNTIVAIYQSSLLQNSFLTTVVILS